MVFMPSRLDGPHDTTAEEFPSHGLGPAPADVLPSRQLVEERWFGPGVAHPDLAERVGDVTLVMKRHAIIKDHLPGEKRHTLIGNHGGATQDEMLIPLVYARL